MPESNIGIGVASLIGEQKQVVSQFGRALEINVSDLSSVAFDEEAGANLGKVRPGSRKACA